MNINDITITSLETIMCFDPRTGAYRFTLDELQNAKIANTQEKQDITGKGGRKLNSLKKNKAVTVTGTNGLISAGLLEVQTGNAFARKKAKVKVPDYLVVNNDRAVTTYRAVGAPGNEIDAVYIKNANGTLGTVLSQDAAAGAGKFTYDPATKELVFNSGDLDDGTEIAVYYFRQIEADVLENLSDRYSEKCELYIDAFGEDKCSNIYRVQFYIPRGDFNGEFEIDMGGDQAVHAFEVESLAGSCGTAGQLWTYTVFGEDAPDAP